MDTRTGEIRELAPNEQARKTEVPLTQQGFRKLVNKEKDERLKILKYYFHKNVQKEKVRLGRKLTATEMKDLKIKTALEL